MNSFEEIKKVLKELDLKYAVIEEVPACVVNFRPGKDDDTSIPFALFIFEEEEIEALRLYVPQIMEISDEKIKEFILNVNTEIAFGAFGINKKENNLEYTHSISLKRKNEKIDITEFEEYLSYIIYIINKTVKKINNMSDE
jgi:hypothetical protein